MVIAAIVESVGGDRRPARRPRSPGMEASEVVEWDHRFVLPEAPQRDLVTDGLLPASASAGRPSHERPEATSARNPDGARVVLGGRRSGDHGLELGCGAGALATAD
jgi:hypothetical protein